MKTKIYLLLIYIIFTAVISYSQNTEALHYKYWTYRQRFIGDVHNRDENPGFIYIDADFGGGTPVCIRDKYKDNKFWRWDYFNPNIYGKGSYIPGISYHKKEGGTNPQFTGSLQFGDGTTMLGNYLAMLALEYNLLKRNGQDTYDTWAELWFAIRAVDRLDYFAENAYHKDGLQDGFFLRSDGQTNLATNFGNDYKIVYSGGTVSEFEYYNSNAICDLGANPDHAISEVVSQDQAIALLFGLYFVYKLVDYENFSWKAKHYADLIIRKLQNEKLHNWIIKDPFGEWVCRGANSIAFSFPLAKIGKDFTGNSYQDLNSLSVGEPCWSLIKFGLRTTPGKWIDLSSILLPIFPHANWGWNIKEWDFNLNMILKLYSITGSEALDKYVVALNAYMMKKDIYDLVFAVFHNCAPVGPGHFNNTGLYNPDYNYEELKNYWETQVFATAPCVGPCFDHHEGYWSKSKCNPVEGWQTSDRWDYYNPTGSEEFYGEYNGIDFMLAYNLYRYVFEPYGYVKMNGVFYQPWQVISPLTVISPNKISSRSYIYANGQESVKYIAGKEIELFPGFETENNAFFDASIESSINCEQNNLDKISDFSIYDLVPYEIKTEEPTIEKISDNELLNNDFNFEVYPNPCKDKIYITLNGETQKNYHLKIFNMMGEIVWQKVNLVYPFPELDIRNINNGVYYLKIISDNTEFTKKIIIQK